MFATLTLTIAVVLTILFRKELNVDPVKGIAAVLVMSVVSLISSLLGMNWSLDVSIMESICDLIYAVNGFVNLMIISQFVERFQWELEVEELNNKYNK